MLCTYDKHFVIITSIEMYYDSSNEEHILHFAIAKKNSTGILAVTRAM